MSLAHQYNDLVKLAGAKISSAEKDYGTEKQTSVGLRMMLFNKAAFLYNRNKLAGIGLNNFDKFYGTKVDYIMLVAKKGGFYNAHNSYLSTLCETGLLGNYPNLYIIYYDALCYS